jgi:hypothetical protein
MIEMATYKVFGKALTMLLKKLPIKIKDLELMNISLIG